MTLGTITSAFAKDTSVVIETGGRAGGVVTGASVGSIVDDDLNCDDIGRRQKDFYC